MSDPPVDASHKELPRERRNRRPARRPRLPLSPGSDTFSGFVLSVINVHRAVETAGRVTFSPSVSSSPPGMAFSSAVIWPLDDLTQVPNGRP